MTFNNHKKDIIKKKFKYFKKKLSNQRIKMLMKNKIMFYLYILKNEKIKSLNDLIQKEK